MSDADPLLTSGPGPGAANADDSPANWPPGRHMIMAIVKAGEARGMLLRRQQITGLTNAMMLILEAALDQLPAVKPPTQ
jgi:hypothetical protein